MVIVRMGTAGMERRWNCNSRDGLDIRSVRCPTERWSHGRLPEEEGALDMML